MTTTDLIDKTDMIAVMPQSIAGSYAVHGLLNVLPCHIQHKMESFGSITRKDRPFTEASTFFLSVIHNADGLDKSPAKVKSRAVEIAAKLPLEQIPRKTIF